MARIPSANPNFQRITDGRPTYRHPVDERGPRKGSIPIPMAFQITSPLNKLVVLLPHALVLHVNPLSFNENFNQKVERFQTRGGWVEQHWGQDLTEISADQSTGAFMNIRTGLTSVLRQQTIAWDRFRDLHDIFRNNGSLHDPFGNIVLQGNVLLMFDRGMYFGHFKTFEWEDTDEAPFAFTLNWSFKVTETIMGINLQASAAGKPAPNFQKINPATDPGGVLADRVERRTARKNAAAAAIKTGEAAVDPSAPLGSPENPIDLDAPEGSPENPIDLDEPDP